MRKNVTFDSAGLKLAGHLYIPDEPGPGARPAIVIAHPASGVKEQTSGLYSDRLTRAGFVTLTYDAAYQGESEGVPRGLEDPAHRVEDIKAAVSFLNTLDVVDPARIGALGICAAGGYTLTASVTDHRVKAVATVSGVDVGRFFREGPDGKQGPGVLQAMLDAAGAARTAEARGQGVGYFPIFPESEEKARAADQYTFEGFEYYCTARGQHPRSAKRFTWSSVDRIASFDGFQFVSLLAPRPLLVVLGRRAATAANTMRSFENAKEPKALFWVDGASHVDLYDKEQFVPTVVSTLADFFNAHLWGRR
jgi:fermentation-respiration switch protein FrsA (DUF1100 family)